MPPFHLFGDLYLDDLPAILDPEGLSELQKWMPAIQKLAQKQAEGSTSSDWDLEAAFKDLVARESGCWEKLGTKRPSEFLILPSGRLNARVAGHLYNPTFHAADPYYGMTEDVSNPSISQVYRAGFTAQDCLIFDHVCRREATLDYLSSDGEDILQVHERFVHELRRHMSAAVEICWGSNVQRRMEAIVPLVPLRLWGQFEEVKIFLEPESNGDSLKRFVIFVYHLQFFFQASQERRRVYGRIQDLSLTVAARLGGLKFDEHFYRQTYRAGPYGRLNGTQTALKKELTASALAQLEEAFPERSITLKFREAGKPKDSKPSWVGGADQFELGEIRQILQSPNTSEPPTDAAQRSCRAEEIARATESLSDVASDLMPEMVSVLDHGEVYLAALAASERIEVSEWNQLPESLIEWIQTQDGLKIDCNPISDKEGLVNAYHLLRCNINMDGLSLIQIAFVVALWYIKRASRSRKPTIDHLLILGAPPRNIAPRKCRKCGQRVLDDAFSYYAKSDSTRYVYWSLEWGCGLPGCSGKTALTPSNNRIAYISPATDHLLRSRNTGNPGLWNRYFVRLVEECGSLPTVVEIQCRGCGKESSDRRPRWTTKREPRYIAPKRTCSACNKCQNWGPTDSKMPVVSPDTLSRLWDRFRKAGCNLEEYPRIPDLYFSNANFSTRIRQLKQAKDKQALEEGKEDG